MLTPIKSLLLICIYMLFLVLLLYTAPVQQISLWWKQNLLSTVLLLWSCLASQVSWNLR